MTKTRVRSAFGNKGRLCASDDAGNIDRLNDVEHQAVSRLDNGNNDDDDVSLDRSVGVCRLVLALIIIVFNPTYAFFSSDSILLFSFLSLSLFAST